MSMKYQFNIVRDAGNEGGGLFISMPEEVSRSFGLGDTPPRIYLGEDTSAQHLNDIIKSCVNVWYALSVGRTPDRMLLSTTDTYDDGLPKTIALRVD